MTNKKISALTSATTPLAGTEVFPLVQSSATVKTPVSAVLDQNTIEAKVKALTASGSLAALIASSTQVDIFGGVSRIFAIGANTSTAGRLKLVASSSDASVYYEGLEVKANGDLSLPANNLVQGTAAKGINFTANTPYSGKTTQLLSLYEEDTFSPSITGLTYIGTPSVEGQYTIIGNIAYIRIQVSGSTSVASTGTVYMPIPFATVARNSVLSVVTSGNLNLPNGLILTNGYAYFPNFAATSDAVILAGWFMTR